MLEADSCSVAGQGGPMKIVRRKMAQRSEAVMDESTDIMQRDRNGEGAGRVVLYLGSRLLVSRARSCSLIVCGVRGFRPMEVDSEQEGSR